MRTVVAFLLGMEVGVSGLVIYQHPRTINIIANIFPSLRSSPPEIKEYPVSRPEDRTIACK